MALWQVVPITYPVDQITAISLIANEPLANIAEVELYTKLLGNTNLKNTTQKNLLFNYTVVCFGISDNVNGNLYMVNHNVLCRSSALDNYI